jgi:hypothetical protein
MALKQTNGVYCTVRPEKCKQGKSRVESVVSCGGGLEHLHRSTASRKRRRKGHKGDINMGTWPFRLEESQMRQKDVIMSS